MAIGAEAAAILVPAMQIVAPVRTGQDDAPGGESGPQRVAIVGTVAEQMRGVTAVRCDPHLQRRLGERDFGRRRRGDGNSQRNTLTLDQYQAL